MNKIGENPRASASVPFQFSALDRTSNDRIAARGSLLGEGTLPSEVRSPAETRLASGAKGIEPTYSVKSPPGAYRRAVFSENEVPLNSAVITHYPNEDEKGGVAIVRALVKANPAVKILMLVPGMQDLAATRKDLSGYYGVPAKNFAPINVGQGSMVNSDGPISLWPQDGFLAGRDGLKRPKAALNHANSVAREVGAALRLPVQTSDGLGMGGDATFLTRSDGTQVAYFGDNTVARTAEALNESRKGSKLDPKQPGDRLVVIGHVMKRTTEAGVRLTDIMPTGVGVETYGDVLRRLTPQQKAQVAPDVMRRLGEMKDLSFPMEAPSSAWGFSYHSDLYMASPDGRAVFVNEDDARSHPAMTKTLKAFGYRPVPLPATYGGVNDTKMKRTSYVNLVMGRLPDGRTAILLPSETMDPNRPTARDAAALATVRREFPQAAVSLIGGETAKMTTDVHWGPHCRTNVMPYLVTDGPAGKSAKDELQPKSRDPLSSF